MPKVTYGPPSISTDYNADANANCKSRNRRPRKQASLNDNKVKDLHEEYKKRYVQPPIEKIPYNKRMARKFASTENQTDEEKGRRGRQADASRISRDRMKFVDKRVAEEHAKLEDELINCLRELLIAEDCVDQYCQKNGKELIDWKKFWENDEKQTN